MRHIVRQLAVLTLGLVAMACASTRPVPHELADAREAYNRAVAGPGAELAPAQLHVAKESLDRAENAFKDDAEGQETKDLAYVAQRKAQLADSIANSELAKQQKTQAEKALYAAHTEGRQQAEVDLQKAREQLTQAQSDTKDALTKLASLKNAVKEDERGVVITLSGAVLFGSNKSDLLPAAHAQLDEIARALVDAKQQKISIEGFTMYRCSPAKNTDLSLRRAQAVADYLVQKGIPAGNLKAVGRGPSNPIASNDSREGRATNRRVEIVVQGQAAASR